jgi:hypothetical protein
MGERKPVKAHIIHKTGRKRVHEKRYGPDTAACVIRLWEFFRGMYGKRLVPLLRANIIVLATNPRLHITPDIPGTDKPFSRGILKGERKKRQFLKYQIPGKVFWPGNEQRADFCETDTVSPDGGNTLGEFADLWSGFTLTITDIATPWTEERTLKNKTHRWVRQAMDEVFASFPVPLMDINRDSGGEFINTAMKTWHEQREITFTRTRSYHKNDTCYVEQKNGDVVRKTVGYMPAIPTREPWRRCTRSSIPLLN